MIFMATRFLPSRIGWRIKSWGRESSLICPCLLFPNSRGPCTYQAFIKWMKVGVLEWMIPLVEGVSISGGAAMGVSFTGTGSWGDSGT